ncbi:MAG: PKD domain-containing protein, partial [Bacteroidota bacterium]
DYGQNTLFKLEFDSITALNPVVTNLNVAGITIAYQVRVFEHIAFISSTTTNKIVPLDFGNSFSNTPVQLADITGLLNPIGFDINFDEATGKYIGFVADFGRITKLDFGNSPANSPVLSTLYSTAGGGFTYGLDIVRDGKSWYIMTVTGYGHLLNIKTGPSLDSAVVDVKDSDIGALSGTLTGLTLIKEESKWHGFINNTGNSFYHFTFPDFIESNQNSSTDKDPVGVQFNSVTPGYKYILLESKDTASQCIRYTVDSVFVRVAPDVTFSISSTCENAPVYFTDETTAPADSILSLQWDFGDTFTSNIANPTHTFADTGAFTITLTVQSLYGYTVSDTTTIYIGSRPTAAFTFTDSTCANLPVQLSDNSSGGSYPVSQWSWSLGNGDSSNVTNPIADYDSASTYTITLTVTDQNGCTSSINKNITTVASPKALFAVTNTCINEATEFKNLTDSNAIPSVTYSWLFGNQQTSSAIEPTQVYTADSIYNVILIAAGSNGCTDTASNAIQVSHKPIPAFHFTPLIACSGNAIVISDSSSTFAGEMIIYRHWDFGDGNIMMNDSATSHAYTDSGVFVITLTVATPFFCDTSITHTVIIRKSPDSDFSVTEACSGSAVLFNNLSVAVTGDPVVAYTWNFGDSTTTSAVNTSHLYAAPGIYNVSLVATSQSGCVDTIVFPAETHVNPIANFTTYPLICTDTTTIFVNLSTINNDTISSWLWSFGDNDTSTASNPSHIYQQSGTLPVTLVATSDDGCTSSFSSILTIHPSPSPSVSYTPTCLGVNTCFIYTDNNIPPSTITNWLWAFGDTTLSTVAAPCHKYLYAGSPTVNVQVTDNFGCKASLSVPAIIHARPAVAFTNSLACTDGVVQFTDGSSVSQGQVQNWSWLFGTSDISSLQNPSFSTGTAGLIPVTLIASTDVGCTDTLTKYININLSPLSTFTISSLISAPGEQVLFESTSQYADNYEWNFGDGSPHATDSVTSYAYQDTALYNVTLIALSNNGCTDTSSFHHLVVFPKPDLIVMDANFQRVDDYIKVSTLLYNGGNMDINSFQLNVVLDGVNALSEDVQLYLPIASTPKTYTFSSRIKLTENENPSYICVEALNPNGLADIQNSDNTLCKSYGEEFDVLAALPNPVTDQLLIRFNLKEKGTVTFNIYDQSGKIILSDISGQYEKGFNSISIDASRWAKGLYAISAENKDVIRIRKVMKQ